VDTFGVIHACIRASSWLHYFMQHRHTYVSVMEINSYFNV